MQIHGFVKTTLLDYPGHLASTIFLGHCNFRCPFCHNKDLVLMEEEKPLFSKEEVLSYLKKRVSIVEGVCISGGEPTLSSDLPDFLYELKSLGFQVKLDSNGYRPEVLKKLFQEKLVDYLAMDIKSSPNGYAKAAGLPFVDMEKINHSISLIRESQIDYEFRTTLVKELHSKEHLVQIRDWLYGSRAYYLQPYQENGSVICPGFTRHSRAQLEEFLSLLQGAFDTIGLRGID